MHVPAWLCLKRAGVLMSRSFKADGIQNFFVGNSLMGMYAKCGSIEDAGIVFIKIPSQNVVTLTTMILGHVQCGQGQKVLELFQQMK
jgi:pentatricopeptide repeat protein